MGMVLQHRLSNPNLSNIADGMEGFENEDDIAGSYPESKGMVRWVDNNELYDEFYASVYDHLTQGSVRTQAEIGLILHEWTKRGEDLKNFSVLDAGCGTGIACVSLAKMNVKGIVGIDKSSAMIKQAREITIPQTTLTDAQKDKIELRTGDLIDPSSSAAGEYTHAIMLYFTIYYFPDKETVFRNLFLWVKPGGKLVIHVVNKHKFDPMLESSSPWLGFSLQKYSKDRITRSEVTFNKFKYVGEFDLHDPAAEFRETFRFNNKTVRRQRHEFRMEDMKEIVGMATVAGWEYTGNVDLTPISFEYAFHLHFKHP
jgi:SAM-dependent methyltransferase